MGWCCRKKGLKLDKDFNHFEIIRSEPTVRESHSNLPVLFECGDDTTYGPATLGYGKCLRFVSLSVVLRMMPTNRDAQSDLSP